MGRGNLDLQTADHIEEAAQVTLKNNAAHYSEMQFQENKSTVRHVSYLFLWVSNN